jgi:hypothetical protein
MDNMREVDQLSFNPEDYSIKEILNPSHTALLVVDIQNDFLDSDGFFAKQLNADVAVMFWMKERLRIYGLQQKAQNRL